MSNHGKDCAHPLDETCANCCDCPDCQAIRDQVFACRRIAESIETDDIPVLLEQFRQLAASIVGDDEALMKDRLGFTFDDMPDLDKLDVEELRTLVYLLGLMSTTVGPFNEVVTVLNAPNNPLARAAVSAQIFDEVVGNNIWMLLRDLVIYICRIGLMYPGVIPWEDTEINSVLGQVGIMSLQTQLNMAISKDLLAEMSPVFEQLHRDVVADNTPGSRNPFGANPKPFEA